MDYLLKYNGHSGQEIIKKFTSSSDSAAVAFAKNYMANAVFLSYIYQGVYPRKEWYKVFVVVNIDQQRQIYAGKLKTKN